MRLATEKNNFESWITFSHRSRHLTINSFLKNNQISGRLLMILRKKSHNIYTIYSCSILFDYLGTICRFTREVFKNKDFRNRNMLFVVKFIRKPYYFQTCTSQINTYKFHKQTHHKQSRTNWKQTNECKIYNSHFPNIYSIEKKKRSRWK